MPSLSAPKTIAGKPVGPIGYGLMSKLPCRDSDALLQLLNIVGTALTLFGGITHDEASKPLKAALENGATFWNAVWTP
jgi:pyridoxine 4-dehydrogenase